MITELNTWLKSTSNLRHKFDAYFLSAAVSKFSEYPQGLIGKKSIAILLKLTFDTNALTQSQQKKDFVDWFEQDQISNCCKSHLDAFSGDEFYVTAEVSLPLLKKLAESTWVYKIQLCDAPIPNRRVDRSLFKPVNNSEVGVISTSSKEYIVAIIDSGCPFAHQGFRNLTVQATSRLLTIWDQDERPDFHDLDGTKPRGFCYGRQIAGETLSQFMKAATSSVTQHLDEDYCYKLAGYDAMLSRETHGSITLGLLASHLGTASLSTTGKPQFLHDVTSNSDAADLVFVQLPRQLLLAPDMGSMERYALDGIRYILNCAGKLTKHIAVVLDYGSDLGAHDGSGLFEQALDALIIGAKVKGITLSVVFPTGNSFEKSLHAKANFESPLTKSLFWALPIASEVPSVAEFWFNSAKVDITFTMTPPNMPAFAIQLDINSSQNYHNYSVTVKQIEDQTLVLLQTSPTGLSEMANRAIAPSGLWRLDFKPSKKSASLQNLKIEAYTAWGGRNEGFAQRVFAAKFVETPFGGFEVTGRGTALSTACGKETYAIGGYVDKPPFPRSKYSGAGPVRGGTKELNGADFLAPTDEGFYQTGLLCMGTRSGTWIRASGTSLAAPQVARALIGIGKLIEDKKKKGPTPDGLKEFGEPRLTYPRRKKRFTTAPATSSKS
jgi:hypothetical protein